MIRPQAGSKGAHQRREVLSTNSITKQTEKERHRKANRKGTACVRRCTNEEQRSQSRFTNLIQTTTTPTQEAEASRYPQAAHRRTQLNTEDSRGNAGESSLSGRSAAEGLRRHPFPPVDAPPMASPTYGPLRGRRDSTHPQTLGRLHNTEGAEERH